MDCNEIRRLLDADLDGELDLVRHLQIEEHLKSCSACARVEQQSREQRSARAEKFPRFTAPSALAERIRGALPRPVAELATAPLPQKLTFPFWRAVGLAASLAVVGFTGFTWGTTRERANRLIDEGVSSHVRSLQASHLTDVTSTDQHTVKPWFSGKLEFAPAVVDLATAGYPLIGGRLDQINGQRAAALVFRRRQHAVNLFVWPATAANVSARETTKSGYSTFTWSESGLNFLAVSEIPAAELRDFVEAYRLGANVGGNKP